MNKKIMKLSVLVGIPVMALFIMVGMASADPRYSIQGVYAVTGFSQCDFGEPSVEEADFIFRHDGTGSISNGVVRNLSGLVLSMTAEFEYTVTKEGRIEITYPDEVGLVVSVKDGPYLMTWDGGPSHGVISPDRKTITISCGPPLFLNLIDHSEPPPGTLPPPPTASCIVSLSGVRIR